MKEQMLQQIFRPWTIQPLMSDLVRNALSNSAWFANYHFLSFLIVAFQKSEV